MIRKLVLTVVAVFGLTTVAKAQVNGSVTINPPTYDTDATRSWKLTFTGGFGNAAGWTVDEFQVVLIPKAGGISRSFATLNPAAQNAWSITTDEAIESGVFNAFVIAKTWDATVVQVVVDDGPPPPPPPPAPRTLICSKVIEVNTGTLAGGANNPTLAAKTYASLTFGAGSPVRLVNGFQATATTGRGDYVLQQQNESFGTDYSTRPCMVFLPADGGEFSRVYGQWTGAAGPNTTITAAANPQPLYRMYIFSSATRSTSAKNQLIATALSTAR